MVTGKNIKRVVVSSLRENLLALLTLAGVLVGNYEKNCPKFSMNEFFFFQAWHWE